MMCVGAGRVDSSNAMDARFTQPGPMMQAPNSNMLLVADQNALRVIYNHSMVCGCASDYYALNGACVACALGFSSMTGSPTCTSCTQGQYNDENSGVCVPCPRVRWWQLSQQEACSEFIDTMVAVDAVGLSWSDIVGELSYPSAESQLLMETRDYVSLQTLIMPITEDAVSIDSAAQSRFWTRLVRVAPPPYMYLSLYPSEILQLTLPGALIIMFYVGGGGGSQKASNGRFLDPMR